jgi:hypothetical protein
MHQDSCPSLDEFEETLTDREGNQLMGSGSIISGTVSSADEDPFITGRFCDSNGVQKQFLFK